MQYLYSSWPKPLLYNNLKSTLQHIAIQILHRRNIRTTRVPSMTPTQAENFRKLWGTLIALTSRVYLDGTKQRRVGADDEKPRRKPSKA